MWAVPQLQNQGFIVLFLYNTLITLLVLLLSPVILYKLLTDKKYRTGIYERLGFISDGIISKIPLKSPFQKGDSGLSSPLAEGGLFNNSPIWFHASSVGEVIASQRLLDGIRKRWPDRKLLVSTFTPTGYKAAREKLTADGVIFLPIDIPWAVNRVMKKVNPSVLILMETELWPNLIRRAGRMGVPVIVVNGRISDRSYGKYWFISPLLKKVFSHIRAFLMQSEGDAGRIITLGADASKVLVTGNIKFDMNISDKTIGFMDNWRGPVLLAGSTRDGEELLVLDSYKALSEKHADLKLVLAPRHLERIGEVEGVLTEKGLHYAKRSEISDHISHKVLLLDTLGELVSFYKYADIVFIGGSLVPLGGHNILEPALYGKPVLFGPHTENFRDSSKILEDAGGGVRVKDVDGLTTWVGELLLDDRLRQTMGDNARQAVLMNQGATEKTLNALAGIIQ